MSVPPIVSTIIVNWNTRELLRSALASLRTGLAGLPHEVIVVDNASADGSAEMVQRDFPDVRLIRNAENEGFGRGNNRAMAEARGRCFLLLNSDARLLDDGIARLLEALERDARLGMVGPRVELESGAHQVTARRFPSLMRLVVAELWLYRLLPRRRRVELLLGHHWDHRGEREVDWLVGACLLVRREVFEETGGFDPSMFMYGEEVEWCRRVREAGWTIRYLPAARVLHLNHKSADALFGDAGRLDQCLAAEDALLRRWEGRRALVAPAVRLAGAASRVLLFTVRRALQPSDSYARAAARDSAAVLGHYWRRLRGRTWKPL